MAARTATIPPRRGSTAPAGAKHAAVHHTTIRRWIAEGRLNGYRAPGTRTLRIDLNELDALLKPIPTAGGQRAS